MSFRVGQGYDVHQFCDDRPLILGGVTVPYHKGLLGHSDADVLTHAVMDALLGALCMGSLGDHFPDTDPKYKHADSLDLMDHVMNLVRNRSYELVNVDTTIVTEAPKLKPIIDTIRLKLSSRMGLDIQDLSVKATTSEKMGFIGHLEGMAVHAVVLLKKQ